MNTTLTVAAVLVSVAALIVSWVYGARSAAASQRSADASETSAVHAKASAESAAKVAQVELERDHESYRPGDPDATFVIEHNPRTGEENLFFTFVPKHSYRILGDAVQGNSRSTLSMNGMTHVAGKPVRVFVDVLRPHRDTSSVEELKLRFYPPDPVDKDMDQWTCRCGRPTDSSEAAHWTWTVPVTTPKRVPPPNLAAMQNERNRLGYNTF
ncbi:hypothetical protein ACFYMB_31235 [Micromonospora haikouensis]|uniref:hypothetical protein n=1 Tax=Micromonospora haikouensis TaxID=686309 RepID=UPI003699A6DF